MKAVKCICGQTMRLTHTETTTSLFVRDEAQMIHHYICGSCGRQRKKQRTIDTSQTTVKIPLKTDFQ